jgi:hypothetical protein
MVHNLTSNEQSKKHVLAMGRIRSELGEKKMKYGYFTDDTVILLICMGLLMKLFLLKSF